MPPHHSVRPSRRPPGYQALGGRMPASSETSQSPCGHAHSRFSNIRQTHTYWSCSTGLSLPPEHTSRNIFSFLGHVVSITATQQKQPQPCAEWARLNVNKTLLPTTQWARCGFQSPGQEHVCLSDFLFSPRTKGVVGDGQPPCCPRPITSIPGGIGPTRTTTGPAKLSPSRVRVGGLAGLRAGGG
jgi:hypothetical protein